MAQYVPSRCPSRKRATEPGMDSTLEPDMSLLGERPDHHISTCSTYAPPHTAGIPWNSVPSPVVRQVAVEVVGGEPHTCGRRQKYVYPTLMHHNMPWNSGS